MAKSRLVSVKQINVNITSSIDVSNDQTYFCIVTRYRSQTSSMFDYQLQLYSLTDLKPQKTTFLYSTFNEGTHPCLVLADGQTIAVVTINHLIFYDRNLLLKQKILHNMIDVYDLQGSPDSRLIALAGNKEIHIWDCLTYKQIIFPPVEFLTKKCKFSGDNVYFGIISQSSLYLYRIRQFGDTYIFQLSETTQKLDEDKRKQFQNLGSFNTFDFNPYNSLQIAIGFGNSSPRKFSFQTKEISKVAKQEQPFQSNNFKVVKYLPDGLRVVSGDYLSGMGYWPGSPEKNLTYKQKFLFFGVEPYEGGRKILGFAWQKLKIAQIQFECSEKEFATSCSCKENEFWDMSLSKCRKCVEGENNICSCKWNQIFNADVSGCVYDCAKVKNAIASKYRKDRQCICEAGYLWKDGKCVFDCSNMFFAVGAGPTPETCLCRTGFTFNSKGKYCECEENSRLVMQNDNNQVSCQCFSGYYFDYQKNKCLPNCKEIRYATGTHENGNCICDDGFYFKVYQNSSAVINDNQYTNLSRTIFSAASGACVRNCSALNNTEVGIKTIDECQCKSIYYWNKDKCTLNCTKITNAVSLIQDMNGIESCSCSLTYSWVPQNKECGRNCDGINFVNKSKYPTTLSCPCIDHFNWNNEPINQCVIDCEQIKFSESYDVNSYSACICRQLFYWDNAKMGCALNCSEIWDAIKETKDGQCSCKNNKVFNRTSMTCQVESIEGVFSKPWVWAVLGVGILFFIIVAIVLIRKFCCNFSDNKQNKEHKKTLKKNTGPKLKKKKAEKVLQNAVSSDRAELAKY